MFSVVLVGGLLLFAVLRLADGPEGPRPRRKRVAVVGGGPTGLFTAYLLEKYRPGQYDVTIYEADPRLGGKVRTDRFAAGPRYEAGAAEIYSYPQGCDRLRDLLADLGLGTVRLEGGTVVLDGKVLRTDADIRAAYGKGTLAALEAFRARCRALCDPQQYHDGAWLRDPDHPWAGMTFREVLDRELLDDNARRYVETAVKSDLACEPEETSALYALSNLLMDHPGYVDLVAIEGGNGRLIEALRGRIRARALLDTEVVGVTRAAGGYRLTIRRRDRKKEVE